MREASPTPGSNAFETMWLLGFDGIGDAERSGLIAEDVRRQTELAARPMESDESANISSLAADEHYSQVAPLRLLCRWRDGDCVARLRKDPVAAEKALQNQQELFKRIAGLSAYGHYSSPLPPHPRAPLPDWGLLQRTLAHSALAHVQGHSDLALAGICNDTRIGRMLMAHSDGVVPAVVGATMIQGNVRLLAEVLAELPNEYPLPASCEGVFVAPEAASLSFCPAMKGEFRLLASALSVPNRRFAGLVWDEEKTLGRRALLLQGACTETASRHLAGDIPIHVEQVRPSLWRLDCVANAAGCVLGDIPPPDYESFAMRSQDAGASLRLAEGLLWMRRHPHVDAGQALAAMPSRLRDGAGERSLSLSGDGKQLQVALFISGEPGAMFSVPLADAAAMH